MYYAEAPRGLLFSRSDGEKTMGGGLGIFVIFVFE